MTSEMAIFILLFIMLIVMQASNDIAMAFSDENIKSRWKELSGYGSGNRDNWNGLLNPLDDDLRRYLVLYGQRNAAVGDLFDSDTREPKRGTTKENFFSQAYLVKGNMFEYKVTDFIYSGNFVARRAFIGFVAETTDKGKIAAGRRDIHIAWRGTIKPGEWTNNVGVFQTRATGIFGAATQAMVHSGFLLLYTGTAFLQSMSAQKQVRDAVRRLVDKYKDEEVSITVTGFSLGGALATLSAMDIVANGYNKPTGNPIKSFKVTVFAFGTPRVGDEGLQRKFNELSNSGGFRLLRISNSRDCVPSVPTNGPFRNYVLLGNQLIINDNFSTFLKSLSLGPIGISDCPLSGRTGRGGLNKDFFSVHNLDVYLHVVAGIQNDPRRPNDHFSLSPTTGAHDYVLVNKYTGRLKEMYKIPSNWRDSVNFTKMVQQDNGRWKVK